MALKEELEILRGEPIEVFTGDPMDIPCIETSDAEKLCKHPVVSVQMITYNHEPYIRQAIEGVMMQKTDFEFELVIGEDCSQDKTREICFEYQKKYPDKIRVLWWHENVSKLGGNGRRTGAHCRGEFIALCEGDDYWIDPLKLQKQVDIMRQHPNVGLCFTGAKIFRGDVEKWERWNESQTGFTPGLIEGARYCLWVLFGKNPCRSPGPEFWQMTATLLARKSVLNKSGAELEILKWKLWVGDSTFCLAAANGHDVYYLGDDTAVYRQMGSGVTLSRGAFCYLDTMLVRVYFARRYFDIDYYDIPAVFALRLINGAYSKVGKDAFREYMDRVERSTVADLIRGRFVHEAIRSLWGGRINNLRSRLSWYFYDRTISQRIRTEYENCGCVIDSKDGRRYGILHGIFRKILTGKAR